MEHDFDYRRNTRALPAASSPCYGRSTHELRLCGKRDPNEAGELLIRLPSLLYAFLALKMSYKENMDRRILPLSYLLWKGFGGKKASEVDYSNRPRSAGFLSLIYQTSCREDFIWAQEVKRKEVGLFRGGFSLSKRSLRTDDASRPYDDEPGQWLRWIATWRNKVMSTIFQTPECITRSTSLIRVESPLKSIVL